MIREKIAKLIFPKVFEDLKPMDPSSWVIKDLVRQQIGSINVRDFTESEKGNDYISQMIPDDQRMFLGEAESIFKGKVFSKVIDVLLNAQAIKTVTDSTDNRQLDCGRFTINGIALVEAEFERLSGLYNNLKERSDGLDEKETQSIVG